MLAGHGVPPGARVAWKRCLVDSARKSPTSCSGGCVHRSDEDGKASRRLVRDRLRECSVPRDSLSPATAHTVRLIPGSVLDVGVGSWLYLEERCAVPTMRRCTGTSNTARYSLPLAVADAPRICAAVRWVWSHPRQCRGIRAWRLINPSPCSGDAVLRLAPVQFVGWSIQGNRCIRRIMNRRSWSERSRICTGPRAS